MAEVASGFGKLAQLEAGTEQDCFACGWSVSLRPQLHQEISSALIRSREDDMPYVIAASSSPSFKLEGLVGYEYQPLKDQDFAVHLVEVYKGHDTFIISKALTRIYYVIEGSGAFTIDKQKYEVATGLVIEVPPGVEYSYSGSMKLLLISHPRWFQGNEQFTRMNPDVVGEIGVVRTIGKRLRRYHRRFRELFA